MENKINIAELLKDCPKGTKLYSPITGECTLDLVDNNGCDNVIRVNFYGGEDEVSRTSFYKYGNYFHNGECLLFPSKGKTTWEGFVPPCQFKDGDIVVSSLGNIHILKNHSTSYIYVDFAHNGKGSLCKSLTTCVNATRLATEEEKQKLFDAIKDNDYKWNAKTKTLEKLIVPKFKVGDRIKDKNNKIWFVVQTSDKHFSISLIPNAEGYFVPIEDQNEYKLAPNKFDITTLVPFESRVLVRNNERQDWKPAFWGYLRKSEYVYDTTRGTYGKCIPYEGNEHLLGTTNDCDNFYKTWEK